MARSREAENLVFDRRERSKGRNTRGLLNLANAYRRNECKDPRDRIFAFISLAPILPFGKSEKIQVDYTKNIQQLFFYLLELSFEDRRSFARQANTTQTLFDVLFYRGPGGFIKADLEVILGPYLRNSQSPEVSGHFAGIVGRIEIARAPRDSGMLQCEVLVHDQTILSDRSRARLNLTSDKVLKRPTSCVCLAEGDLQVGDRVYILDSVGELSLGFATRPQVNQSSRILSKVALLPGDSSVTVDKVDTMRARWNRLSSDQKL